MKKTSKLLKPAVRSGKLVEERERAYMRAVARWEPVLEAAKVSEKMTDDLRKHARRLGLEVKTTYDAMIAARGSATVPVSDGTQKPFKSK